MLDPDQVIINRHKLAELQDTERRLNNLEARLRSEEQRVVEVLMPLTSVEAILKTKDGLMAPYRLPKGHTLYAPLSRPIVSAAPLSRDMERVDASVKTSDYMRIYHFAGFFGSDRRPLYQEK